MANNDGKALYDKTIEIGLHHYLVKCIKVVIALAVVIAAKAGEGLPLLLRFQLPLLQWLSEESANKNNRNNCIVDEYKSNEVAIASVCIVHVIRIEAEKYFEDAVAQCGTIPRAPDIVSGGICETISI